MNDDFAVILSTEGKPVEKAGVDDLIITADLIHLKVQTNQDTPHAGIISLLFTGGVSFSGKTILHQFKHNYTHRPSVQALAIINVSGDTRVTMLPLQVPAYELNFESDETNVYLYIKPNFPPYTPPILSFSIRYQVYVDEAK